MDGAGEHYAKWNKSVRERQIPYDFTHMWNLMNWINKQNGGRLIEQVDNSAVWEGIKGGSIERKRKRTLDMDNNVLMWGGGGWVMLEEVISRINDNGKYN